MMRVDSGRQMLQLDLCHNIEDLAFQTPVESLDNDRDVRIGIRLVPSRLGAQDPAINHGQDVLVIVFPEIGIEENVALQVLPVHWHANGVKWTIE